MLGSLNKDFFPQFLYETIEKSLPLWGITSYKSIELLCISENITCKISLHGEKHYVLRIHRPQYNSFNEIYSELTWIKALHDETSLTLPVPIKGCNGELIQNIYSKEESTPRYAVLFSFFYGREPEPSPEVFYAIGKMAAQLHQHTASWSCPLSFKRPLWDVQGCLSGRWGNLAELQSFTKEENKLLADAQNILKNNFFCYGNSANRFGLIHSDLRVANLLQTGNEFILLDFDDCGFGWYMYDAAASVSFMEESDLYPFLSSWIFGYTSVSTLTDEDISILPSCIMLRRLSLTAWVASRRETSTYAQSLGDEFIKATVKVAQKYLNNQLFDF